MRVHRQPRASATRRSSRSCCTPAAGSPRPWRSTAATSTSRPDGDPAHDQGRRSRSGRAPRAVSRSVLRAADVTTGHRTPRSFAGRSGQRLSTRQVQRVIAYRIQSEAGITKPVTCHRFATRSPRGSTTRRRHPARPDGPAPPSPGDDRGLRPPGPAAAAGGRRVQVKS